MRRFDQELSGFLAGSIIAAEAIGQIMVGDNPGTRVDPEVIAPLSKLKNLVTGGGTTNVNITLSGELRVKGRDLVYTLGKENFKIDVLGG